MGRTLCFDFDGVIHSYTSGWTGPLEIIDPPVEGMAEAMHRLKALGWNLCVCSSRARHAGGTQAIKNWMAVHGFPTCPVDAEKPPAELYIDDRALRFDGVVPAMMDAIDHWAGPWNRGGQE